MLCSDIQFARAKTPSPPRALSRHSPSSIRSIKSIQSISKPQSPTLFRKNYTLRLQTNTLTVAKLLPNYCQPVATPCQSIASPLPPAANLLPRHCQPLPPSANNKYSIFNFQSSMNPLIQPSQTGYQPLTAGTNGNCSMLNASPFHSTFSIPFHLLFHQNPP
jgi:hypothetical protein